MISSEGTALVIHAARGILALAQRAELHVMLAGRAGLAGPPPTRFGLAPRAPSLTPDGPAETAAALRALIDWEEPPAPGADRARLHALLDELDHGGPGDLGGAGSPERAWHLVWAVVDAVRGLGPEGAARFSRSGHVQRVAAAVLQHMVPSRGPGDAGDLQDLVPVRVALRATLAACGCTAGGADWVGAILGAMTRALTALAPIERASFAHAWLESPAYARLLATALARGSAVHGNAHAVAFGDIAAVVLSAALAAAREQPGFASYWSARWGDALRSVLVIVTELGPAALEERAPRIADLATMLVHLLSVTATRGYLGAETLADLVAAALAATAAHPAPRPRIDASWLDALLHAVTDTLSDPGTRQAVPADEIESLIQHTLVALARRPEAAQAHPGLVHTLVHGVLAALTHAAGCGAHGLAATAIHAALGPVTEQPALIDAGYPRQLAALAGKLGALVRDRALTRARAAGMLRGFAAAMAEAPGLFVEAAPSLAPGLADILAAAARTSPALAGPDLVAATRSVLQALVRSGHAALERHGKEQLVSALDAVIGAALAHAQRSVGTRIGRHDVPAVLGEVVEFWAHGHISHADAQDPDLQERFAAAVRRALA